MICTFRSTLCTGQVLNYHLIIIYFIKGRFDNFLSSYLFIKGTLLNLFISSIILKSIYVLVLCFPIRVAPLIKWHMNSIQKKCNPKLRISVENIRAGMFIFSGKFYLDLEFCRILNTRQKNKGYIHLNRGYNILMLLFHIAILNFFKISILKTFFGRLYILLYCISRICLYNFKRDLNVFWIRLIQGQFYLLKHIASSFKHKIFKIQEILPFFHN